MSEQSGSWQPDPTGRHQYRYFDDGTWTDQVSDDGVIGSDPYAAAAGGTVPPAASPAAANGGGGGNKTPLIIGGVVLLVLLAIGAFLVLGGDDEVDQGELAAAFRDQGMPEEQAECFAGELSGVFTESRIRELDGGAEPTAEESMAMLAAVGECGLGGFEGGDIGMEEGDSYGDNPTLDALWDACEDGDGDACDDLYFQSPVGSEYEEFGDTCGGRRDGGSLCSGEDLD